MKFVANFFCQIKNTFANGVISPKPKLDFVIHKSKQKPTNAFEVNSAPTMLLSNSAVDSFFKPLQEKVTPIASEAIISRKTHTTQAVKQADIQQKITQEVEYANSIYHSKYDQLRSLVDSHQKAVALDKLIYRWQISKYTLGDNQKWFTRSYTELAEDLNTSVSTLKRWLNYFEDLGVIERKTKMSSSSKSGTFKPGNRTYIRITDKLLAIIKQPNKKLVPSLVSVNTNIKTAEVPKNLKPLITVIPESLASNPMNPGSKQSGTPAQINTYERCSWSAFMQRDNMVQSSFSIIYKQNELLQKLKMSFPIYKEENHNQNNGTVNNTVSPESTITSTEGTLPPYIPEQPHSQPSSQVEATEKQQAAYWQKPTYKIEEHMDNTQYPLRLKNLVKGMLANVQKQSGIKISDPEKTFAETIFSITQDEQWDGITDISHRVNIVAKLLKQNRWRTPKGFHKYSAIGQYFYAREKKQRELYQRQKQKECKQAVYSPSGIKAPMPITEVLSPLETPPALIELKRSLRKIEDTIFSEKSYIQRQTDFAKGAKTPEAAAIHQAPIDSALKKIARLNAEREEILAKIEAMLAKVA